MPYKPKNSKYWYIRIPDGNGNKIRRSSGTTDHEEAKALENKYSYQEFQRVNFGVEPDRLFDDCISIYLDDHEHQASYKRNLWCVKQLKPHFSGMVLNDLDVAVIRDYKQKRKVKPDTIRKELGFMSTCINYAVKTYGWKISNPVATMLPKKGKGRIRWITQKEADKLILHAETMKHSPYLVNFITLALNTGMRKSEMLGLTWDRIDFYNRLIYLNPENQKNKTHGSVPLNPSAMSALENQIGRHEKWVFYYRKKHIEDCRKSFRSACDKAGIEDFRIHDLRHTFAAWAIQKGIPLKTVQELLRHEDIQSTMIYTHLSPDNIREASDLMEYKHGNRSTGITGNITHITTG